jgi:hypothetical protein
MYSSEDLEQLRLRYKNEALEAVRQAERKGYAQGLADGSRQTDRTEHLDGRAQSFLSWFPEYFLRVKIPHEETLSSSGMFGITSSYVAYTVEVDVFFLESLSESTFSGHDFRCEAVGRLKPVVRRNREFHELDRQLHSEEFLRGKYSNLERVSGSPRRDMLELWLQCVVLSPRGLQSSALSQFLSVSPDLMTVLHSLRQPGPGLSRPLSSSSANGSDIPSRSAGSLSDAGKRLQDQLALAKLASLKR